MQFSNVIRVVLLILGLAMTGCVSGYQKFYTPVQGITPEGIASKRVSPPPAFPLVERAQPENGDRNTPKHMPSADIS